MRLPDLGLARSLYEHSSEEGLGIEWHDFRLEHDSEWAGDVRPHRLELCLNFSGHAMLCDGSTKREIGPNQFVIRVSRGRRFRAARRANSPHKFITIGVHPRFLRTHFGGDLRKLTTPIRHLIESARNPPAYLEIRPLPSSLLPARVQFLEPPVFGPARRAWYLGRTLEILAQVVYHEEARPRKNRGGINQERIERVQLLIERNLANSPSLEDLAREAGCSSYHLSRMFARETGASIPFFLRTKRLDKAAELLRHGRANVSEAAAAVGYASLSSFSKAFKEQMGCSPRLYAESHAARDRE